MAFSPGPPLDKQRRQLLLLRVADRYNITTENLRRLMQHFLCRDCHCKLTLASK